MWLFLRRTHISRSLYYKNQNPDPDEAHYECVSPGCMLVQHLYFHSRWTFSISSWDNTSTISPTPIEFPWYFVWLCTVNIICAPLAPLPRLEENFLAHHWISSLNYDLTTTDWPITSLSRIPIVAFMEYLLHPKSWNFYSTFKMKQRLSKNTLDNI